MLSKTDDLLTLTCDKQRDAEPFDSMRIRLVPVEGTDSCAVYLADSILPASFANDEPFTPAQHQVLRALADVAEPVSVAQLDATIPKLNRATIYRALNVLKMRGLVAQDGQRYRTARGVA